MASSPGLSASPSVLHKKHIKNWQWDSELYKNVYADAEIRGTLVEDGGTAVNNLSAADGKVMKVLRDGQLYLIYKGTMYNVQGAKTK